jgi:hypothetical protein
MEFQKLFGSCNLTNNNNNIKKKEPLDDDTKFKSEINGATTNKHSPGK